MGLLSQGESLVVVGDVAPAAADLARELDLPLAWVASFGWDEIYGAMGPELAVATRQSLKRYRQGEVLDEVPPSP